MVVGLVEVIVSEAVIVKEMTITTSIMMIVIMITMAMTIIIIIIIIMVVVVVVEMMENLLKQLVTSNWHQTSLTNN